MTPEYSDRNGGANKLASNILDFTDSPHVGQLSDYDLRVFRLLDII